MIVGREELERSLGRVAAACDDPAVGLFGPGSLSWRWNRETWNFVGAGRAALLQLAHPAVAHAIDQHSVARTDARGRFRRTFANLFAMTFGDLASATRAARRVHGVHARINGILDEDVGLAHRGDGFRANEVEALVWVHATLVDTVMLVRRLAFGDASAVELATYYDESRRFAALFGIPEAALPADAAALGRYVVGEIERGAIAVGRPARETADALLAPPHPALAAPFALYRRITATLLPARLRHGFGLPDGRLDRAVAGAALRGLGVAWPRLPAQLRVLPAALAAEARLGVRRPGPIGRVADKLATATGLGVWPRATR